MVEVRLELKVKGLVDGVKVEGLCEVFCECEDLARLRLALNGIEDREL